MRRKREEHAGKGIKEGNGESWSSQEGIDDAPQGQTAERMRRFVVVCSTILSQRKTRMWWAQRVSSDVEITAGFGVSGHQTQQQRMRRVLARQGTASPSSCSPSTGRRHRDLFC